MRISGTGISIPQDVKVLKTFRPRTKLGLKWQECSDGSWVAADHGLTADTYEADIECRGHYSDINNLVDALQENRAAGSHAITLSWIHSDEHFFGEDVDHSTTMTATVLDFGTIKQTSWGGYGVDMRLRALSPSLIGTASLPTLQYMDYDHEADSSVSVNKIDTWSGAYAYSDHQSDKGRFVGTFRLGITDMRNLRCYLRTTRGSTFQVASIAGVKYPWGPRRGAWPMRCKCIAFDDLGMVDEWAWRVKLTLVEA